MSKEIDPEKDFVREKQDIEALKKAKDLAEAHWRFLERWMHLVFVDGFLHGFSHGQREERKNEINE